MNGSDEDKESLGLKRGFVSVWEEEYYEVHEPCV